MTTEQYAAIEKMNNQREAQLERALAAIKAKYGIARGENPERAAAREAVSNEYESSVLENRLMVI